MKTIVDYIAEVKQNFIISGHTKDQSVKHNLTEKPAKFCSKKRCIDIMQQGWSINNKTEKSLFYIRYCIDNFLTDMHIKYIDTIKAQTSYRCDYFVFEYNGIRFVFKSGENWVHDESYFLIRGIGDNDDGSKSNITKKYNNDYIWRKSTPGYNFSGQSKHISILFNKENIDKTRKIIELVCKDYCYNNPYKGDIPIYTYDRCIFKHGDYKIFR